MRKKLGVLISAVLLIVTMLSACSFDSIYYNPNKLLDGDGSQMQQEQIINENETQTLNYPGDFVSYDDLDDINMFAANVWSNKINAVVNLTCFGVLTNDDIYTNYGEYNSSGGNKEVKKPSSAGTGFIITSDGYLITNSHVVVMEYDKYKIIRRSFNNYVVSADGSDRKPYDSIYATFETHGNTIFYYKLEIVDFNSQKDLAILKFVNEFEYYTDDSNTTKANGFPVFCDFFDSDFVITGEPSIAIGNAQGYGLSITAGLISQNYNSTYDAIMTSAPINPGNSGGPLFNVYSQVIGVNSSKLVNDAIENMGFAIPSNTVTAYIDSVNLAKSLNINYTKVN